MAYFATSNDQMSSASHFPRIKKAGVEGNMEEQVTSDFMKLMDAMEGQRDSKISALNMRNAYRKKDKHMAHKDFSRSNFIKPA